MNVIVILHKDVYNIPAYHVVKEMLRREYHIDFFAFFFDQIHIRMFNDLNIKIHDIKELEDFEVDKYDFLFSAVYIDAIPNLMRIRNYIFTFSTTFMDELASYGDYTFTQRDMSNYFQDYDYSVERTNRKRCSPGKAVGNPKFDIEEESQSEIIDKQQILFVEASHYPYGKAGKMEEAKMLLKICRKCSQYKIIVKPRFFPKDKNVTHGNRIHLYQCIDELTAGNIPDNLVLLHEHMDLEKLVFQCITIVVTEMTTSYLDIGAFQKHGIIASNLPSEDSLIHNKNHMTRFRNIQKRSGLCVDYKHVTDYLPHGLSCKQEHILEMGIDKRLVSKDIVDEMERIYTNYLIFNKYPSPDISGEAIGIDEVISYRYLKRLYLIFDPIKEVIEELDFREAEEYIENLWNSKKSISEENYREYEKHVLKITQSIMLSNKKVFMKDALSQTYYIKLLYDIGKIQDEDIELYEEQAEAMYFCLMGKYKVIKENQFEEAIKYFQKYFYIIRENDFEKTLADTPYYKESATYWIGLCYYKLCNFTEAKKYFIECQRLTNNNHIKAAEYLEKIDHN